MERSVAENDISIRKSSEVAKYLAQIDPADADGDFYNEVFKNSEEVRLVCCDDCVVGLVLIRQEDGFLYVYIFPEYRQRGYGFPAAGAAERQLYDGGCICLGTAYDSRNEAARRFAEKCGFVKRSSTCMMKYRGERFEHPEIPVRKYRDEDFLEAYTLSAEAFHIMRVETGHDPDSVPYAPDEEARQYCADTAEGRYVYELDGEIIGCANVDGAELDNVAIRIDHQGKGFGKVFVKFLVNEILDKGVGDPFLYCLAVNQKARRLYDSLGFEEVFCNVFAVKTVI